LSKAKSIAKVSTKSIFNIFWGLIVSSIVSAIGVIIGDVIFLSSYLVAAPLMGALTKADVHNFKDMVKGLGPIAPFLSLFLSIIERLIVMFQRS